MMMPMKIVRPEPWLHLREPPRCPRRRSKVRLSNLLKEHQDRGPGFCLHYRLLDKSGASIGATRAVIVERRIDGDNGRTFRQQPLGKIA